MPENPKPRIQIFRPGAYDRYLVEGARELIEFAKKVLAESDPSVLFRWRKPEPPSESQSPRGTTSHPGTPRATLVGNCPNQLRAVMQEEHLTVDQCDELAKALREDAACLPHGAERENLLQLAKGYRLLAAMKRMVLRKVN